MQKEIFIYVHIPKCFGTSFLDSIRNNEINNNPNINKNLAWFDIFHRMYAQLYPSRFYKIVPNNDQEVTYFKTSILPHFLVSKKNKLLIHLHQDTWNIDKVIPKEIKRTYIVTVREPKSRLISAYKYRLQQMKTDHLYSNANWSTSYFFENAGFYNGPERLIPRIFGIKEEYILPKHLMENIVLIDIDEYNKKGHIIQKLEKDIGIKLDPCHTNASAFNTLLPGANDVEFWIRMKDKYKKELRYYTFLINNNFSDLFLNY